MVQAVPALAARVAERLDREGVFGQLGRAGARVVVVVELDQELDLVALGGPHAVGGGRQQPRQAGIRVVLAARAEDDAEHGPSLGCRVVDRRRGYPGARSAVKPDPAQDGGGTGPFGP